MIVKLLTAGNCHGGGIGKVVAIPDDKLVKSEAWVEGRSRAANQIVKIGLDRAFRQFLGLNLLVVKDLISHLANLGKVMSGDFQQTLFEPLPHPLDMKPVPAAKEQARFLDAQKING